MEQSVPDLIGVGRSTPILRSTPSTPHATPTQRVKSSTTVVMLNGGSPQPAPVNGINHSYHGNIHKVHGITDSPRFANRTAHSVEDITSRIHTNGGSRIKGNGYSQSSEFLLNNNRDSFKLNGATQGSQKVDTDTRPVSIETNSIAITGGSVDMITNNCTDTRRSNGTSTNNGSVSMPTVTGATAPHPVPPGRTHRKHNRTSKIDNFESSLSTEHLDTSESEDTYDLVIDLEHSSLFSDISADRPRIFDKRQLIKQCRRDQFVFNIMAIGETGIGKSTLMDTLFNTNFDSTPASHDLPGVKLKSHTYELQETNVRLKLTVVDTVGFGDQIDKSDSYKPIVDYIDSQFEAYLQEELKVKRSLHTYHDSRIHACLYFIAPTGHSLKSLDLVTMKALDRKVNIIPVVAKADTITKAELQKFKARIMGELKANQVQIYQFPTDDETVSGLNTTMNNLMPFAVVGSMDEIKVGNKMVKARQYPWGTVQVENENHCDFVKLREMLIRTNMEDMREGTHLKHYEMYRRNKLSEMGFTDDESMSLQETYEAKRSEHLSELQKKEEEMRQMFVVRVKEKEAELKEAEKELHNKFETLKKQHHEEKKKFEDKKKRLDDELDMFQKKRNAALQAAQAQAATMGKRKK